MVYLLLGDVGVIRAKDKKSFKIKLVLIYKCFYVVRPINTRMVAP